MNQPLPPALQELLDGNRRYREGLDAGERDELKRLAEEGQAPEILVISCSDSRASVETATRAKPGQLFVARSIAATVPPYRPGGEDATAAALEYAVTQLEVRYVVVCGHSGCGGVHAARSQSQGGPPGTEHLPGWLALLRSGERADAIRRAEDATTAEREAVRQSLDHVAGYPFVAERLEAGRLALAGCHYRLDDGRLDLVELRPDAAGSDR